MLWMILQPVIYSVLSLLETLLPKKRNKQLQSAFSAFCIVRAAAALCGRNGWLCAAMFGNTFGALMLCGMTGTALTLLLLLDRDENSPIYTALYIFFCTSKENPCLAFDTAACSAQIGIAGKTALLLIMLAAQCVCSVVSPLPEIMSVIGFSALMIKGIKGMEKEKDIKMYCAGAVAAVGLSFLRMGGVT